MERRKKQATLIKRWKPWLKATGPCTKKGKAIISRNAYQHGFRSKEMKEIYRLLRWQRDFVKNIERSLQSSLPKCVLDSIIPCHSL